MKNKSEKMPAIVFVLFILITPRKRLIRKDAIDRGAVANFTVLALAK